MMGAIRRWQASRAGPREKPVKPTLTILRFKRAKPKKVLAIDLGKSVTKAVCLEMLPAGFKLHHYVVQPTPPLSQASFRADLANLLKNVQKAFSDPPKRVVICLSMADAVLRDIEMPNAPVPQLRRILKFNPKQYLQQEVKNYSFDCCIMGSMESAPAAKGSETVYGGETETGTKVVVLPSARKRLRVLAGGAADQLVNDLHAACHEAGMALDEITLSQLSLVNAAIFKGAEAPAASSVALVDIGFTNSTISILMNGELMLTRVIGFGGDQLTAGLAKAMDANYRVAEAIKTTLPQKVQDAYKTVLATLSLELRTAIDFFEKQHDVLVGQALISGASARSKFLLEMLESELRLPCLAWNAVESLEVAVPPEQQGAELEASGPQLNAAIGAAQGWLGAPKLPLNLLAEKIEEELIRARDPVRWALRLAAGAIILVLAWATILAVQGANKYFQLNLIERRLNSLMKNSRDVSLGMTRIAEMQTAVDQLKKVTQSRFLWTGPLGALQSAVVTNVQLMRLQIKQTVAVTPAVKPQTSPSGSVIPGKPAFATEQLSMVLTAKNYGDLAAAQQFIETIKNSAYFKTLLRTANPVLLRDRLPEQADPLNPERTFSLFTIECFFQPRVITDD